jgi:hypothetical protein
MTAGDSLLGTKNYKFKIASTLFPFIIFFRRRRLIALNSQFVPNSFAGTHDV